MVSAPGTCGEFAQGVLPDGTPFHVTCPINKSATVVAQIRVGPKASSRCIGLHDHHRKLGLAIEYAVDHLDLGPVDVTIRHWSDLDIGKGMGSSTADVLSRHSRCRRRSRRKLSTRRPRGSLRLKVESSDGSMYPGIAAVDHKSCKLLKAWDWYPEFVIVMLVPLDSVDTHSIPIHRARQQLAVEYEDLAGEDGPGDHGAVDLVLCGAVDQIRDAFNEQFLLNPYASNLIDRLEAVRRPGRRALVIPAPSAVCCSRIPRAGD